MMPAESAHDTVAALGHVGLLQFKDLNTDKSAFQRSYASQVQGMASQPDSPELQLHSGVSVCRSRGVMKWLGSSGSSTIRSERCVQHGT